MLLQYNRATYKANQMIFKKSLVQFKPNLIFIFAKTGQFKAKKSPVKMTGFGINRYKKK
jgi:hypothetical protein